MATAIIAGVISGFTAAIGIAGTVFSWSAFAISAGLSLVSRALTPKPDLGSQMNGQSVMTREAAHSRKIVYGRARIGGNVVYLESTGDDNKYLWLVIAVAGHEIDAYEKVYFNDKLAWQNGSYYGSYSGKVEIGFFKGDQTSADNTTVSPRTDNLVNASDNKWTNDHKLLGTAYMVVRLEYDQEVFSQGLPNISTVVRGKKVLDPTSIDADAILSGKKYRIVTVGNTDFTAIGATANTVGTVFTATGTTSGSGTAFIIDWSQNPALCIYDYLRDTQYGLGESESNILTSSVTAAKTICDQSIDLNAGGNQPRYTIDGVVDTGNSIKANIENMTGSMIGRLIFSGGKFEIHAGAYVAPTVTIDESMIVGEISVQTKQSRRNAFNGVKGVFLSEQDNYVLADYPAQISSTFAAQDGDPIYLDMPLPYTVDNVRAQRIAKLALLRSRQQEAITIPCNLNALKFKVGDNINISYARLGYSNPSKIFEVVGYSMSFSADQMVVNVEAIETASNIWDWETSDEEVFLNAGTVDLYEGGAPAAPASLTVTGDTFISSDGTDTISFNVSWPASVDAFVDHYVVEWNQATVAGSFQVNTEYKIITVGTTDFTAIGAISNSVGTMFTATGSGSGNGLAVDTSNYYAQETKTSPLQIVSLNPSKTYEVRVKAVNELNVNSVYVTSSAVPATDTTAPDVPTNPEAKGEYRQIQISWTNPTQKDLKFVEVFRSTTGLANSFFYVGNGDTSFIDTDLDTPRTYYYQIRSSDDSFNKSDFTATVSATSRNVDITAPDNPDVVIYDGESGLPPSITSGRTSLDTNTSTFYLKQDYKEHLEMRLSYPVGALTSGSISGEANSINAVMAEFKFQVFYAPISDPTNFTQFGETINKDVTTYRKTNTTNLSVGYYIKTTDLGSGNFKAELQTKSEVNALYPALSGRDLGNIDDNYNLTRRIIQYDFPAGEYVFKVVVVAVNGSYTPYPSTGSPSVSLKRTVTPIGYQAVKKNGYSIAFEPYYQPITVFRDEESNEIVRLSEGADTLELSAINSSGRPDLSIIGGGNNNGTVWGAKIKWSADFTSYQNGSAGDFQIGIDQTGTRLSLGTAPASGGYPRGLNPQLSELQITSGRTDILGSLFLNGTQITGTGTVSQAESYPVSQYYDATLTTTSTTIGSFTLPAPDSAVSKRQELDISVLFEIQNNGQTAQALSSIDFIVEKKSKGVNAVTVGSLTVESAPHTNMQLISVSGNQLNKVDIAGGVAASADASNTNEPASINSVYYDTTADKTYILSEAASSIFSTGNTLYYSDSKFASTGTWVQPSSTEVIDSITPPDPDINYVNATSVSSGTGKSRFYIPFKMSYGKTTTATDYRIKISVSSIPTGITYKAVKMFGSLKNIA